MFYIEGLNFREKAQANQMTAGFLMPFPLIKRLMDQGESTLAKLAN